MKPLHMISFILLVIGGLNWGIFAISGTELGTWLGGMDRPISKIIYILVGVAAIVELLIHPKTCKLCPSKGQGGAPAV